MAIQDPSRVISTILKHDNKQTSYKIALLRAINDVVLSHPDLRNLGQDVAIPLRVLAKYWLAYYWPFVDPVQPIMQGARAVRGSKLSNDMAFRSELATFRQMWQEAWGGISEPADGFFVIEEMRVLRNRASYSSDLQSAYNRTLKAIARTIEMPIRYAGPDQWQVFDKPVRFDQLVHVVRVPGTQDHDVCVVVTAELWRAFHNLSLWVEALCIHEWCSFTERVEQPEGTKIDRGITYVLLTARPDNRRPLTWERNQIDLLLMEGYEFVCPWTERRIKQNVAYDLDHVLPVSVYPINELWNLVPSDPYFNSHTKRDRLPTGDRLLRAQPHLVQTYHHYHRLPALAEALREDIRVRFVTVRADDLPRTTAEAVVDFVSSVADSRNLARF